MDNVNRNIAMKMIIGAARRAVGRQYIFITPQSMQDVHSKNDVKIIRYDILAVLSTPILTVH